MASENGTASLTIRRGARVGRRLKIELDRFRVGQQEDCDLVLKDGYVSPVHAVIERSAEGWVVRNQGVHGTLVNGKPVEGTRPLVPGDAIQVGAETLLEFAIAAPSRKKKAAAEVGPARPWWRHPAAIAGIGIYLLAIGAFFVFLATLDRSRDDGLAYERVGSASEATRELLLTGPLSESAPEDAILDPDAEQAHDFYALETAHAAGRSEEVERLTTALLERVEAQFFQAWQYEQRGAHQLAIDRYREVVDTIPTLRAPVTRLASRRIRALREKVRE